MKTTIDTLAKVVQDGLIRNEHKTLRTRIGVVGAAGIWIGFHYSETNNRLCIGLGLISIWIVFPGGYIPTDPHIVAKTIEKLHEKIDLQDAKITKVIIAKDPIKSAIHKEMTGDSPIDQPNPRLN